MNATFFSFCFDLVLNLPKQFLGSVNLLNRFEVARSPCLDRTL